MSEETVEIVIGGQKFNLRSRDGVGMLQEYASYANGKLHEVTDGHDGISTRVALLALLNLTEELFTERAQHHELLKKIEGRAEKIQSYLNSMDSAQ